MYSSSHGCDGCGEGVRRGRVLRERGSGDQRIYRDQDVEILRSSEPRRRSTRERAERDDAPGRRFVVNVNMRREPLEEPSLARESRYVTVKLPLLSQTCSVSSDVGVGLEYRIRRSNLARCLPNTAGAISKGILDLGRFFPAEVMRNNPADQVREGCIFVFDFINDWTTRDRYDVTDTDPFDEIILGINSGNDKSNAVMDASVRLLSLCVVLHRRAGLGCLGQLLDGVGRFADGLFTEWGDYMSQDHQIALFSTLLGINTSRSAEWRGRMQNIWDGFGHWVRQSVVERVSQMRNASDNAWEEWVMLMDLQCR